LIGQVLLLCALAVIPVVLIITAVLRGNSPLPGILLGAAIELIGGSIAWSTFLARNGRLRRRLRAASGRLCVHCTFDLRGMDDTGTCPECGRPFDAARDRQRWRELVGDF